MDPGGLAPEPALRIILQRSYPDGGSIAPCLFLRMVTAECREDHNYSVLCRGTSTTVGAFPPITADVRHTLALSCSFSEFHNLMTEFVSLYSS